jgi:hypothetical protein
MVQMNTSEPGAPIFKRVLIMKDRNPATDPGESYALLLETSANSFDEAAESMKKIVKERPEYKWVKSYMDDI